MECTRLCGDIKDGRLEMLFPSSAEGEITLFGITRKISKSSCLFDTGGLSDGIYTPVLTVLGRDTEIEGFEIKNKKARLIPKDDAYVRALAEKLEKLEWRISKTESRLDSHDEKIYGNPLF